ncbi:AAA family ATPase [Herminiimonas fonticola]|uniref:ATPase family protein associated with various cellular activities (AAA) n=1 Tax=Herminiimonas fonticola TaxID=303380 RepID=A0A4V3BWE2_9BURK|nr:ATP-binding protein [Herminiimonas fonticola]RBA25384.1 ATPase family associated with various cellular activities (AAA) [Herminiimonas fonticola]TDN94498.1 ATPase family protein associated with various cellular activities (AAA) [Herminiimonas fonticola]
MDFEIPESLVTVLLGMIEVNSPLAKRLNEHGVCHGKMVVPSHLFDAAALNTLYDLCKAQDERALMFQMLAQDNIRGAPQARKIPSLDKLVPGLAAYFSRDVIDGWLYKRNKDGVLLPWLIHRLRHIVPDQGAPYVVIDLLANTMQAASKEASPDHRMRRSGMTNAIVINANDIANRTIPELLIDQGYFKECAEFKQEYEEQSKRFLKYQAQFGAQFVARNSAFYNDEKSRFHLMRFKDGVTAKCVNDEENLDRRFEMSADPEFWRESGFEVGFEKIPLHCYLYMFHLELHQDIWVHVQNLTEYQYKPELRDKLILPDHHRDLIDILTADMTVLMEDIVEGKSGGTTILCKGAPGLGKTLTAEVYSEVVGKPLYRVHSGQLGITAASVEQNLSQILRRAARWDAILLLDEADVYIRCRDNDLQHNAIVAEFLRTLEYFNGLLFMTTNRIQDVDDAILSRCIATIQYETPSKEDAMRLWKSLATQFNIDLSDELIDSLSNTYSNSSGRDIKELLKLTSKFCKSKKIPFSEETFRQCAMFRGIN